MSLVFEVRDIHICYINYWIEVNPLYHFPQQCQKSVFFLIYQSCNRRFVENSFSIDQVMIGRLMKSPIRLIKYLSMGGLIPQSPLSLWCVYLGLFNLNILTKSQTQFIYNVMEFDNPSPRNYYKYKENVTSHSRLSPKWIHCKIRSQEIFTHQGLVVF